MLSVIISGNMVLFLALFLQNGAIISYIWEKYGWYEWDQFRRSGVYQHAQRDYL